jgi:hypothetical protein
MRCGNIKTDDIKKKIELKKQELEKQLETLEKLEVDGFTEDNGQLIDKKKEEIKNKITKIGDEIKSFEETMKQFKDGIQKLKENK